jgi:hypothetical protein
MDWLGLKAVASDLGVEKDALHVYAAFFIQVGVAFALKRSLADWGPWLAVLGALLVNEYLDIFHGAEIEVHAWQLWGSCHDIINTMVLPTVLLLLSRLAPHWLTAGRTVGPASDVATPDGD